MQREEVLSSQAPPDIREGTGTVKGGPGGHEGGVDSADRGPDEEVRNDTGGEQRLEHSGLRGTEVGPARKDECHRTNPARRRPPPPPTSCAATPPFIVGTADGQLDATRALLEPSPRGWSLFSTPTVGFCTQPR